MLRKISRLLQAVHFNFDNRDRINTLIALLAYWEAKCETQYEESTIEFAEAIKDRILRQRQELDTMRSKRHPTPEKLTIQLVPSSEEVASRLVSAGHNPKLQLTLKSKKSMASIIEHLNSKWTAPTGTTLSDTPLRLYVPDKLGQGYGVEAQDVTILSVFHAMNCPAICRLEYNWDLEYGKIVDAAGGVLPGHEHQELQSTSDEHSTGDEHSTDSHRSISSISAHNTRTRTASPTRAATAAATSPRHNSGSPPRSSGSHHSPRSTSVNRLAVPENVRGSAKVLSEDALDDDAIRQGLIMRKATKSGKGSGFKPASPGSSTSPKNSPTRAARASPPHNNAGMASRATRYSMRSRRAAAASTAAPTASAASSASTMERSQAMDASMAQQGQQQYSDLQMYADSVDSEDGLMNDVTGEFYGEPSSELENLEAMPTMEYGFGATYVDAPFEGAPRVGAQPGAHLGVNGLNHAHATMVVNNHYYQPTWDHSQSYFMGAQPQQQIDPYYAAYPNAANQQPNAQGAQNAYYAPQDYYPQEYYPQPNNNQRGGNGSQGYFYGK